MRGHVAMVVRVAERAGFWWDPLNGKGWGSGSQLSATLMVGL